MKSIKTKLVLYFCCLIVFITATISFLGYYLSSEGMKGIEEKLLHEKLAGDVESTVLYLEHYFGDITYKNGTLLDEEGINISGRFEVVDTIMEDLGDVATIFVKSDDDFQRVLTNITTEKGERAVGTFLGKDSTVYSSIINKEKYVGEATILGQSYLGAYNPLFDENKEVVGILFVGVSKEEAANLIKDALIVMRNVFIVIMLVAVAISVVATFIIGKRITEPIILTIKYADNIANLDVSQNISESLTKQKDEIGRLARAFRDITENLRKFIITVVDASGHVASSSEELTAISQQSSMASEEVARAIEEIAKGATDQARDTENGASKIIELGSIIEEDLEHMKELNISSEEVARLKDEGFEVLEDLVEKTEMNVMASKEIGEAIVSSNDSAERISSASEMIRSIAEQTNLLALNAAIEAARAGDAGRGFAVVAEEIRKLAEESNKFTEEIALIIKELTGKTENAVVRMKDVSNLMVLQTEGVELTKQKFQGIALAVEKTKNIVKELDLSSQAMEEKKDEIVDIIQNLSAIAEENAAGTEEASASVEEQTASMVEIANSSEKLAHLAVELMGNIERFKY